MLDKLKGIEERYDQLGQEMLEVGNDYQPRPRLTRNVWTWNPSWKSA